MIQSFSTLRWAREAKPYTDKDGTIRSAFRMVADQPLVLSNEDSESRMDSEDEETGPRYNLRKLSELPYHLIRCDMWNEFVEVCCPLVSFIFPNHAFISTQTFFHFSYMLNRKKQFMQTSGLQNIGDPHNYMFLKERSHLTICRLLPFLFIALPVNKGSICYNSNNLLFFFDNSTKLMATNLHVNDQVMLINQHS